MTKQSTSIPNVILNLFQDLSGQDRSISPAHLLKAVTLKDAEINSA